MGELLYSACFKYRNENFYNINSTTSLKDGGAWIRRFKNYAFKKPFNEENCLMYGSNIILESNTAVYDGGAWYRAYNLNFPLESNTTYTVLYSMYGGDSATYKLEIAYNGGSSILGEIYRLWGDQNLYINDKDAKVFTTNTITSNFSQIIITNPNPDVDIHLNWIKIFKGNYYFDLPLNLNNGYEYKWGCNILNNEPMIPVPALGNAGDGHILISNTYTEGIVNNVGMAEPCYYYLDNNNPILIADPTLKGKEPMILYNGLRSTINSNNQVTTNQDAIHRIYANKDLLIFDADISDYYDSMLNIYYLHFDFGNLNCYDGTNTPIYLYNLNHLNWDYKVTKINTTACIRKDITPYPPYTDSYINSRKSLIMPSSSGFYNTSALLGSGFSIFLKINLRSPANNFTTYTKGIILSMSPYDIAVTSNNEIGLYKNGTKLCSYITYGLNCWQTIGFSVSPYGDIQLGYIQQTGLTSYSPMTIIYSDSGGYTAPTGGFGIHTNTNNGSLNDNIASIQYAMVSVVDGPMGSSVFPNRLQSFHNYSTKWNYY